MYEEWKQFIESFNNQIKEQQMNQEIIRNLEVLIALVKAYPEELFDLHQYEKKQDCGTLYCTAGLAATQPYFQMKGLTLTASNTLSIKGKKYYNWQYQKSELDVIFGEDSFCRLFQRKGDGVVDHDHPDASCYKDDYGDVNVSLNTISDKELAIWRLERQLAIYKEKE